MNCFTNYFLGKECELTQIAACTFDWRSSFSQYILPDCEIDKRITEITSLAVGEQSGKRVLVKTSSGQKTVLSSISCCEGLTKFTDWLDNVRNDKAQKVVLLAHNAQGCDMRHLIRHIEKHNLFPRLSSLVLGFVDSLKYARVAYEGVYTGFSLPELYSNVFNNSFDAHDASADAEALRKLVAHSITNNARVLLKDFSFNLPSAYALCKYNWRCGARMTSLQLMYEPDKDDKKVISKLIAEKITGSGLIFSHLQCVYKRSGEEGLVALLKAKMSYVHFLYVFCQHLIEM